jgi:hypothetical protein
MDQGRGWTSFHLGESWIWVTIPRKQGGAEVFIGPNHSQAELIENRAAVTLGATEGKRRGAELFAKSKH